MLRIEAAGALELVEFVLGFVRLPAEADGTAAEADGSGGGQVGFGGITEGLQSVEAEADDLGGEAQFFLGLNVVAAQGIGRCVASLFRVSGGGEEKQGEVAEHRAQNELVEGGWEGHSGAWGWYVILML